MALTVTEKESIIKLHSIHKQDVGSPEVQISLLTADIIKLHGHFDKYKKDNHSKRGLIGKVNKRRKLLKYLKNESEERYKTIILKLKLRK